MDRIILSDFETTDDDKDFSIAMEDSVEEEIVEKEPKKKSGQKAIYVIVKKCKDFDEAKAEVEALNFGKTDTKAVKGGRNHFYRCKEAIKRAAIKCPNTMKVFESNETGETTIYSSNTPHDHNAIDVKDKSKKMSPDMRAFIVSQRRKHMVAKDIMKSIDEMKSRHNMFVGEPTPNAKQIYYVSARQISAETPHMISIGAVVAWCQNNETVPMDDDAPFVIGYEHSSEDEHRWFRFMFSAQKKSSINF